MKSSACSAEDPDFVVLTEAAQEPPRLEKAPLAAVCMLVFLVPAIAGWLPIDIAALAGAVLMVLSGCLHLTEAYDAVDWKSLILIAGMLPLGVAMQESGGAGYLAEHFVHVLGPLGPRALLAGIFVLTSLATCVMPGSALVVLMAPIALKAAASAGMSPYAIMMAVALAAAGTFNSPVSHPANVMIMGPGGYRYADYVKLGIPLTLVVLVVVILVLPLFWPLTAG